jgi:hypothetical protein
VGGIGDLLDSRPNEGQDMWRFSQRAIHVLEPDNKRSWLNIACSLLVSVFFAALVLHVTSLFEEDVDGTFFKSAPGHMLVYCERCERQRVLPDSGQEIFCSGGKFFGKHVKSRMLRLGTNSHEDTA